MYVHIKPCLNFIPNKVNPNFIDPNGHLTLLYHELNIGSIDKNLSFFTAAREWQMGTTLYRFFKCLHSLF